MTRRSFGLTVIAASVASNARAGGPAKWALLSDTHISEDNPTTVGALNAKAQMETVVGKIDRTFDGLRICGDATQAQDGSRANQED